LYIKINKYQCSTHNFSLVSDSSNKTKNEIIDIFDEIIKNKKPEKSYIIEGENYTVFINPIERYLNESNVNIYFSECEKILKEKYPSFNFRLLQINSKINNPNCLNEDVEYLVYNQYGERMDLSCCKDVKITIQNKIKAPLDLEKIKYFKNKGIDIFQLEDDFFNDVCYPYSDENSDSDMILKDRVSDIYQNFSLCEKECEYELFNDDPVYVNCICNVKQDISKEIKEGNFKIFLKPFLYTNFGIIKCYKLVFGIEGKLKNIGFWLFGILILFHIPIYIYYFKDKINPIKIYVDGEMVKFEYKSQIKDTESSNTLSTIYNITNKKEDKKISKKLKKLKKRKSKFYTKNNFPPKKHNLNNSFYSDIGIKNKIERQLSTERELNNINDKFASGENKDKVNKEQNCLCFSVNEKNNFDNNDKNKNITKKFRNTVSNNFSLNEGKKEEFKDYYENKLRNRSLLNIIKIIPENNKEKKINTNFPLILINANNKGNHYPLESNYVLNNYDYNEAIINEKRNFFRIFFIFIISKDDLLNLIFFNPPLELKPLRIIIFIFNYICDLSLNALFYLSDNISDQYRYKGKFRFFYTLINNLTISLSSTIIAFILLFIFQSLTESSQKIKDLFLEQEELLKNNKEYKVSEKKKLEIQKNIEKILKCLKIKIIVFFILEFLINLFFYYYIIAFCHVYKSTQISWLLDSLYSYFLSFIITLCISFVFSILYKLSIKFKIKILYKIMMFYYE
jgi:hypothetical protein